MKGGCQMLNMIAAIIVIVILALSFVSMLHDAEASSQRCRDEILIRTGFLF